MIARKKYLVLLWISANETILMVFFVGVVKRIINLEQWRKNKMGNMVGYQFLNSVCPVCDKVVDGYNYKIIDGKKYHISCSGVIE